MLDWEQVVKDVRMRNILWDNSGLSFMLEPWLKLVALVS